jgi:hypothetical protein
VPAVKIGEWAAVFADLEQQGATVKPTRSGWMIRPLQGPPIAIHKTESDRRALHNTRARIRRAGLIWPPDRKRTS